VLIPCDGVLFDNDGVLVDSDASVHQAWTRWALEHDLPPGQVTAMVHGRRSADTVELLIPEPERHAALAAIDRMEVEAAAGVTAVPGAAALLGAMNGTPWAVVTSGVTALATARLAAAGLPLPPLLIAADDIDNGKPAPDGYLAAAHGLGLPPNRTVGLEDSPAGIAAAQAAGVAAIIGVRGQAVGAPARGVRP
jgi:sugar-phosphatase